MERTVKVQSLWSGYGEIVRCHLRDADLSSVIVKHVTVPSKAKHPKGWNSDLSHYRKWRSYQVESNWYQQHVSSLMEAVRVPKSFYQAQQGEEFFMIMEDLDASGFHLRYTPDDVTLHQAKSVLSWLAAFHANSFECSSEGLWEIGTYWHLSTRPMEWDQMQNQSLKQAANTIDEVLNTARYQSLVHGDAKLANFCFSPQHDVAAVDFQYVGRGCGMKDVAYFISSCFDGAACELYEEQLLDHYFSYLKKNLPKTIDYQEVKKEWSYLYGYAWADFYRFLDGWSPGHWKMHGYSKDLVTKVLSELA